MAFADVISTVQDPARRLADVLISVVHPHARAQQSPQQGPAQPPTPPAQPAWYTEGFRTVRAEAKAKGEAATRAEARAEEAAARAEKVAGAGAQRSLQSDELYGHGVELTKQVEEELKKPQPDMAKVRNLQQLAEIAFSGSIGYAPRAGSSLSGGKWETLSPNVPGDKTAATTDYFGQPIDPSVRYDRKRNPVTDEVGWFATYAKPLPDRPAMETTETRTGTDAFGFPSTSTTRRVTGPVGAPTVGRTTPSAAPSAVKAKPVAAPAVKVESGTPAIKRSPQVEAMVDAAVDVAVATKKMPAGKLGMAVAERMKERGIAIPTPDTVETRKLQEDVRRTQINLKNAELGAQRGDNPGDYLLVENFMQLSYGVDPKAMRGSDRWFAQIQQFAGGSLPQRILGDIAKVSGGGILSPDSRASLLKLVRDMAGVRIGADQTGTGNPAPVAAEDAQKGADAIDAALQKKK